MVFISEMTNPLTTQGQCFQLLCSFRCSSCASSRQQCDCWIRVPGFGFFFFFSSVGLKVTRVVKVFERERGAGSGVMWHYRIKNEYERMVGLFG